VNLAKPILVVGLVFFAAGGRAPATTLTYPDLVKRITDLEQLAALPVEGEACGQASSWDRKSRYDEGTGKYVDWFANGDGGGFIREENGLQVLAEMDGPGCIWRIWSATPEKGRVRIYLDGAAEPAVDLPFADYFQSGGLVGFPALIYKTAANGFNLRIPIPYRVSCKIVAEPGWGKYFQFTHTTFPKGTVVPTFSRRLIADHFAALQDADALLSEGLGSDPAGRRNGEKVVAGASTLAPGQAATVARIPGPRAITAFRVRMETNGLADAEAALRTVALSMRWDGEDEPSVWSPLGDFFGTAPGLNRYRSLPMGLTEAGFYSYWYMPFAREGAIEVRNDGAEPVSLDWSVTHAPLVRPAKMLGRFHAKWHRDALLPPEPERDKDWTMLRTAGRGRYCGVALHVWNPRGDWWGEGDEKFYSDGAKFPLTFGTGSEDYFGYAWSSATLFYQALHSQTRNDGGSRGHISVNRWHVADNVPFQTSFVADIEKYFPNDRPTRYDGIAYWYQAPGGADPYRALPVSERIGIYPVPEVVAAKGAIEGESLKILEKTGGETESQAMHYGGGAWSDERQLFWKQGKPGDRIVLAVPVPAAGRHAVHAQMTRASDYGVVELRMDGEKLGEPFDGYHTEVAPSGELDLGARDLTAGEHKLTLEIVGANPAAKGHCAGLDYIRLEPEK
jgi:hypothetical protein